MADTRVTKSTKFHYRNWHWPLYAGAKSFLGFKTSQLENIAEALLDLEECYIVFKPIIHQKKPVNKLLSDLIHNFKQKTMRNTRLDYSEILHFWAREVSNNAQRTCHYHLIILIPKRAFMDGEPIAKMARDYLEQVIHESNKFAAMEVTYPEDKEDYDDFLYPEWNYINPRVTNSILFAFTRLSYLCKAYSKDNAPGRNYGMSLRRPKTINDNCKAA